MQSPTFHRLSGLLILLLLMVSIVCPLLSQQKADTGAAEEDAKAEASFPESWQGVWKGKCRAGRPGGQGYSFAMELHIQPVEASDRLTWKLIYGEGEKRQVRDYELAVRSKEEGEYVIDEKNSIAIDSFLIDGRLCSQYSVGNSLITVTYSLADGTIVFELMSSRLEDPTSTGGEGEIPEVLTYVIEASQKAVLKKQ